MTSPALANPIRPLLTRLVVIVVASAAGGAAVVGGLAAQGGEPPAQAFGAAGLGAGAVLIAGLLGAMLLGVLCDGSPAKLAAGLLASSTVRLLGSLGLGLGIYLLADPSKRPFWFGLLASGLASLVLETMLFTRALARRAGPAHVDVEGTTR